VGSQLGEGSTFHIYLPVTEKPAAKEEKQPEDIVKGTETILFVDDEDMIIDVGYSILEMLGYTVLVAKSGKEALEVYRKNMARIDMVILDMIMPRMDGGEIYEMLKVINKDVKVLLSSGYSVVGKAEEILAAGCDGFIQKPFNMEELSKKMREILDKDS
jgi:CheY-like chemotaxis protein